jgi:hypothetical protein
MQCPRCGWILNNMTKDKAAQIKTSYGKAFAPWSPEDDKRLQELVEAGKNNLEMSQQLARQPSAIKRRIELLGLKRTPILSLPQKDYLSTSPDSAALSPASPTEPVGGG